MIVTTAQAPVSQLATWLQAFLAGQQLPAEKLNAVPTESIDLADPQWVVSQLPTQND